MTMATLIVKVEIFQRRKANRVIARVSMRSGISRLLRRGHGGDNCGSGKEIRRLLNRAISR